MSNPTPPPVAPMPNPTEADLADPVFEALWQEMKLWDVNVPRFYQGYCGASGSHVMLLLAIVRPFLDAARAQCGEAERERDGFKASVDAWREENDQLRAQLAEAQGRLPVDVIALHRPATSDEHGIDGSIHGFCVRCRTPWPCDYSPEKRDTLTQQMAEARQVAQTITDAPALISWMVSATHSDVSNIPPLWQGRSQVGDIIALRQQLAARTAKLESALASEEWGDTMVCCAKCSRAHSHGCLVPLTDANAALRLQVGRLREGLTKLHDEFSMGSVTQRFILGLLALTPDPGAAPFSVLIYGDAGALNGNEVWLNCGALGILKLTTPQARAMYCKSFRVEFVEVTAAEAKRGHDELVSAKSSVRS